MAEPFIFSSQITQVFFSDIVGKLVWKVIFQKEAHSRREVVETPNVFIPTMVEMQPPRCSKDCAYKSNSGFSY